MKRLLLLVFSMIFGSAIFAQNLDEYQWRKRLLLVFSPSENSELLRQQLDLFLEQKAENKDRDLIIFQIHPDGGLIKNTRNLTKRQAQKLFKQFDLPQDQFNLLLIGKDSGVKFRSREITNMKTIYNLIDQMPMRRSEMKSKFKK